MLQLLSYSHFFTFLHILEVSHNSVCIQYQKYSHFLQHIFWGMSIFKYFGKKLDSDTGNEKDNHRSPAYLPSAFESGLGQQEYQNVVSNVVDLANPLTVSPATGRQRGKRQSYAHYSGEMRAKIGKYAGENGNEKARNTFQRIFPTLKRVPLEISKRNIT